VTVGDCLPLNFFQGQEVMMNQVLLVGEINNVMTHEKWLKGERMKQTGLYVDK